jgi:hypothetical protein
MAQEAGWKYFVSWIRWQGQDGYALWLDTPNKEWYWTDAHRRVPLFATTKEVAELALQLNYKLEDNKPVLQDLDSAWNWMQHPNKLPNDHCLAAWHLFSDLGAGIGVPFSGDTHAPTRDRVFDLLYAYHGPWLSNKPAWKLQERKVLKRILQEGFRMWQKYAYWSNGNHVPSGT